MTKHEFILITPRNDVCIYTIQEHNLGNCSISIKATLAEPSIPPTIFQCITDDLLSKNIDWIKNIYFDHVILTYRIITFNLYGHVRDNLVKELRHPISVKVLREKRDDYNWIEDDFFPKFPPNIDGIIDNTINKPKNLYTAFRRGSFKGTPYTLPESFKIVYNPFYEIHPTDIIPYFDTYLTVSDVETSGDKQYVKDTLIKKFNTFNIKLIFKP